MNISIPYGRGRLTAEIPDSRISAILCSRLEDYTPSAGEADLIRQALESPIGAPKLEELAREKKNIVLIASDHTRPVPSKLLVPPMLEAIRRGNPDAEITILIATGCHRGTTKAELIEKFGSDIVAREKIAIHDCADEENMVSLGILPSGGELRINRIAAEADLLVSEGFIEPHFFAGFSGGRKSVLPGIVSRHTVYWNHNADFIGDPHARTGILEGNPLHRDMVWAARKAKLAFICNVVINAKHQVVGAFAGDMEQAHLAGTEFLGSLCGCPRISADIVITTNNGYPLDQNIYQAVKGMTAGESCCREGGVIIMAAACEDGHGGESFMRTMTEGGSPREILDTISATPPGDTVPDQWESQILARILCRFHVILISRADPNLVRAMKMTPAASLEEAMTLAESILGGAGTVTVIPEGISIMIR